MESVLSCVEVAHAAVKCSAASSIRVVVVQLELLMKSFANGTSPLPWSAVTLINAYTKEVTGQIAASLVEVVCGIEQ